MTHSIVSTFLATAADPRRAVNQRRPPRRANDRDYPSHASRRRVRGVLDRWLSTPPRRTRRRGGTGLHERSSGDLARQARAGDLRSAQSAGQGTQRRPLQRIVIPDLDDQSDDGALMRRKLELVEDLMAEPERRPGQASGIDCASRWGWQPSSPSSSSRLHSAKRSTRRPCRGGDDCRADAGEIDYGHRTVHGQGSGRYEDELVGQIPHAK
jgi:hypothetical protein